jgi:hypothetical protein
MRNPTPTPNLFGIAPSVPSTTLCAYDSCDILQNEHHVKRIEGGWHKSILGIKIGCLLILGMNEHGSNTDDAGNFQSFHQSLLEQTFTGPSSSSPVA